MTTHPCITTHAQIVAAVTRIRDEWQEAADGIDLIELKGSVGLLLGDLVSILGLNPDEQVQALGEELFTELESMLLVSPVGNGRNC
jgi:hypothetical protein